MRKSGWSLSSILILSVFFGELAAKPALAYIDPGTGSYVLQIAIGAALAGAFILKSFWQKIINSIKVRLGNKQEKIEK